MTGTGANAELDGGYGCPTFRYCDICHLMDGMSFEQADVVRAALGGKWCGIFTELMRDPDGFRLGTIQNVSSKPFEDSREGPAIRFPEINCTFSEGTRVIIASSITVCVPPNHSKIWIRISNLNEDAVSLNESDLNLFFTKAKDVSQRVASLLFDAYRSAIEEQNVPISLATEHKITIETATADLGEAADLIQSRLFRMSNLFDKRDELPSLSELFRRTYGRDINSKELQASADEYQWIKMMISGDPVTVSIYSKHHQDNVTRFVGRVHESSSAPSKKSQITRDSSAVLVQQIASAI